MRVLTRFVLAAFVLLFMMAGNGHAIIVFEKGKDKPIRGYLVSANDFRVIVDELLPSGATTRRYLPRTGVEEMIVSVSPGKLESLRVGNPKAYRDYADELYAKKQDPDARVTAIRLYLIAAYLDPENQGRSCLLHMSALARDPAEQRKFRAMGYLLDPDHDRSVLKTPELIPPGALGMTEEQRKMLQTALRSLRSTKDRREAVNLFSRPVFKELLGRFSELISEEEFNEAIRSPNQFIRPTLLKKILALELALSTAPAAGSADDAGRGLTWSQLLARRRHLPVSALNLETLTDFDPNECHYEPSGDEDVFSETSGKWVAPK